MISSKRSKQNSRKSKKNSKTTKKSKSLKIGGKSYDEKLERYMD
jgi:hypothetical protein